MLSGCGAGGRGRAGRGGGGAPHGRSGTPWSPSGFAAEDGTEGREEGRAERLWALMPKGERADERKTSLLLCRRLSSFFLLLFFLFFSFFFRWAKQWRVFFVSRSFFLVPLDFAFQALEVPQSGCQRSGDITVNN